MQILFQASDRRSSRQTLVPRETGQTDSKANLQVSWKKDFESFLVDGGASEHFKRTRTRTHTRTHKFQCKVLEKWASRFGLHFYERL